MMPGMDGIDVGRQLSSTFGTEGGRLVLTKSAGSNDLQDLIRGSGITRALSKPIRRQLLLEALVGEEGERHETAPSVGSAGERRPPAPGRGASEVKILLAEDNIINQRVAMAMLLTMGHQVANCE